ncbi:MAG: response regulator, partial [Chlorobi bacterium]|nr:response regulator [Chlorobiota bacterium]
TGFQCFSSRQAYSKPNNVKELVIYTDAVRFKQIISNLLSNAFKYTEKGTVEFGYHVIHSTKNANRAIEFFVKDTGIGIKKDQLNIIFDRFRKLEAKNEKIYSGAGIGLTIVKTLVNLLNGKLRVESKLSVGSTFFVEFPLPDENLKASKPAKKSMKNKNSMKYNWENIKILVAEDEASNFKYIEAVLKQTKAKLIWAINGNKVIEELKNNSDVNLILMDIKMPDMDGYEAAAIIRKTNKIIPIIAQTAYAMSDDKEKILKNDFTDYISKPVKINDLLNIIALNLKLN